MAVDPRPYLHDDEAIDDSFGGDHRSRAHGPVRPGRPASIERTGPDSVKAEIMVKMGAMSMTFTGTVEIIEKDPADHRAVLTVKSRETGGQGYANATVTFALLEGGGDDPHRRPDHGQGGVDGRGGGRRRARRADRGLHLQGRRALSDGRAS